MTPKRNLQKLSWVFFCFCFLLSLEIIYKKQTRMSKKTRENNKSLLDEGGQILNHVIKSQLFKKNGVNTMV